MVDEEKEPKTSDSVPAPPKIINSSKQAVLSNLKEVEEDSDELDDSEGDTQALIAPVSVAPTEKLLKVSSTSIMLFLKRLFVASLKLSISFCSSIVIYWILWQNASLHYQLMW